MKLEAVKPVDAIPKFSFDKEKISFELMEILRSLATDRQENLSRKTEFLLHWNDYLSPIRRGPWAESSNIHLPLTMDKCLKLHAKLLQAFFFYRPWFYIVPREKLDIEVVQRKEQFMHWTLTSYINYFEGIFDTIDKWLWETVTNGWSILKLRWEKLERRSIKVEKDENGNEVEKDSFSTIFDGPVVEVLRQEDCYMMGDYDSIQKAPFFAHGVWMTENDLKVRRDTHFFYTEAVDKVLKKKKPSKDRTSSLDGSYHEIRQEQDIEEGVETLRSGANTPAFRILECYWTKDIDKDGYVEENILWVEEETGEILRHTFLDRVNQDFRRSFFKASLIKRPHRAYDMGLVEILYPLNSELDAIHNQKIDFQTLVNIPWFVYNPASGIKGEEMRLGPGVGIPVDDVNNGIRFPNFPQSPSFHFNEEISLRQWAGDLTGLSGPIVGQAPSPLGAGRTATGFSGILNEQIVQLDPFIKRIQIPYQQFLKALDVMLQTRLPDGIEWRVLGADGIPEKDSEGRPVMKNVKTRFELQGSVDYELLATSANLNKEVEFQRVMLRNQVLANPLDIQLGLQNVGTLYENRKDFLRAQGVLDPDRLIIKPQAIEKPLTLSEEIASIVQGRKPRIVLNDSHEEKIGGLKFFFESEEYRTGLSLGNVAANSEGLFRDAIAEHEKFAKSIGAQAQMSNVTGLQIAPSLSARVAGSVDQASGQGLVQSQMPQEGAQEGAQEGGEGGEVY